MKTSLKRTPHSVAIALLLGSYAICNGQSHDPKNPTPLGPGINKGNVDNVQNGPNYYYFYAGPGAVNLNYAFKEMGVFGNPLKQALSFDLFDENNKLLKHDAIVSVEKMEKLSQPGTLDKRSKLLLRVISPDAAIRLGGYYEIEATGAVAFGGQATGAGVKPIDTSLTHSVGALSTSGVQLSNSGVQLSTSGNSLSTSVVKLNDSGVVLYTPVGALTSVQDRPRELRLTLAADILFDFDKATIRPDATAALDRVAQIIRAKSRGVVRIEGFTDSKGMPDYNVRLSDARAGSVQKWLTAQQGLQGAAFTTQGFGATRFAAKNTKPDGSDDPAGRQKNRRVEIVIQK
jgi:outer membrane protein OmpA-like peptidoglycan-associated protein